MAIDRMEINNAFKQGLISLTFIGKDNGERVEMKLPAASSGVSVFRNTNFRRKRRGIRPVEIKSKKEVTKGNNYFDK